MRKELQDYEVEAVSGGTVILSIPLNIIGFNTTGEMFKLKGDPKKMRNKLIELYDENENMGDAEFDQLVKNTFLDLGWI